MTKSINVSLGLVAVLSVLFMFASFASAASVTNVEYSNGDVTVQGKAGESVSGKVRIVVPANEEVEFVQFDVISDNLAPVCVEVSRLQEGTHFVNIPGDVKFPPNTGTYDLQVKTSGIFGGLAAIDCNNNVTATQSFNNSVRTVGSSSTSSNVGSTSWMQSQIDALKALIEQLTKPTVPVASTKCSALASKMAGAVYGTRSSANIVLQGYLLSEGASIPALAAGAAFGFYGDQTMAAVSVFKAQNSCI
jgi:hypothetical protein